MSFSHPFRRLLVALLCLWLPLQAAAGTWLPCHELDGASEAVTQQDESGAHRGCKGHQAENETLNPLNYLPSTALVELTDLTDDTGTGDTMCYHCQVSCHFSSAILFPGNLQLPLLSLPEYLTPPNPAFNSALLDNPQRPPRIA